MAQFFVPGPALLYAGVGGSIENRIPLFLGTSIAEVRIEVREASIPVFNSLGGRSIPMDEFHDGEVAFISFASNYFKHDVVDRLMTSPNPFSPVPGTYDRTTIGALYGTEGLTFPFWVVAPYASNPTYAGMPAGYRFWSCKVEAPKSFDMGAKDKTYNFVIKAMRAFTTSTSPLTGPMIASSGYPDNFMLYDEDITGLPDPD